MHMCLSRWAGFRVHSSAIAAWASLGWTAACAGLLQLRPSSHHLLVLLPAAVARSGLRPCAAQACRRPCGHRHLQPRSGAAAVGAGSQGAHHAAIVPSCACAAASNLPAWLGSSCQAQPLRCCLPWAALRAGRQAGTGCSACLCASAHAPAARSAGQAGRIRWPGCMPCRQGEW